MTTLDRFTLVGPLAVYTGYANGFKYLVRELIRRDIDFYLFPVKGYLAEGMSKDITDYILDCHKKDKKKYSELGIVVGIPPFINEIDTKVKIIYTMYETTNLPSFWIPYLKKADWIFVPSNFCYNLFSKYSPRVKLVRWGIDNNVFRKINVPKYDKLTFASVGVQSERKGIDVLLNAFNKAFPYNRSVQLIIKNRGKELNINDDNGKIIVVNENWDEEKLVEFYNKIHCLVLPTRGEGVGMPPLQAAMCGTPALVTRWSGPVDYIDSRGIWGIDINKLVTAKHMLGNGYWAEPDVNHLCELMRQFFVNIPEVRGDYSLWHIKNTADEFLKACSFVLSQV